MAKIKESEEGQLMKIEIEIPKLSASWALNLLKKINIGHLLLISFALHMFALPFPQDGMIFDEVHYIKATRAHLEGIGANAEHMPLVKLFMSFLFPIFGDYWFTWRFPIVVSCMISYVAFYYIARHFLDEKYSLIATAFLCFDVMYFIHGTIYLLDMPAIMFGLISIATFLSKKYKTSALTLTLAILCKEIALLFLGVLVIYELGTRGKKFFKKENLKIYATFGLVVIIFGFSFIAVYDTFYKISTGVTIMKNVHNTIVNDAEGNPITTVVTTSINTITNFMNNPTEHFGLFWKYHTEWMTNFNSSYRAFQKPWTWALPLDVGGVLDHPSYFTVRVDTGNKSFHSINWRGQGTIPIWYTLWFIFPLAVYKFAKGKERNLSLILAGWITSTYFSWIVLELIKKSTGFNYYFIYTVPALCIGIPYLWKSFPISDKNKTIGIGLHLFLTIVFFMYYFPVGIIR